MATVMVTIDGKNYRMACDEGQEDHLSGLAHKLDRYISHLKSSFGEIGDHRLSVMAGIMVMDELNELEKRVGMLEEENIRLKQAKDNAASEECKHDLALASSLENAARRIEALAVRIAPKN